MAAIDSINFVRSDKKSFSFVVMKQNKEDEFDVYHVMKDIQGIQNSDSECLQFIQVEARPFLGPRQVLFFAFYSG